MQNTEFCYQDSLGYTICHEVTVLFSKSHRFQSPAAERLNLNWIENMAEIRGGKKTSFQQVHSAFSNMKDDRCCHFESLLYPKDSPIRVAMVCPSGQSARMGTYNVLLGEKFWSSTPNSNLRKSESSLANTASLNHSFSESFSMNRSFLHPRNS